MPKVVLSGYFGFNNAGDEAILAAEIAALRQLVPGIELVVLSGDPSATADTYDVQAIPRSNLTAVWRALSGADLLISGGGSLLQDITSNRSIPYYLGVVALAKLLGIKAMIYANGVGPINQPFNRCLVHRLGNLVDLITVRDAGSKSALEQLGIDRPPIKLTADAVFTLQPSDRDQAEQLLVGIGAASGRQRLGVSVRNWSRLTDYKRTIAEALDAFVLQHNLDVIFLPLQYPDDVTASEEVQAHMKQPSLIMKDHHYVTTTMALYGAMDMVLGIRLHALVFAALQGVPHVGIVYDPKVKAFLDIVGQPVGGVVDDLDAGYLADRLAELWLAREAEGASLGDITEQLTSLAWQNARLAAELLGEGPDSDEQS